MSLRDLVEGECGGANSLVGLTSHYVQDRGLKEEGIGHGFSLSNDNFSNADADQLVNQFLGETLGHAPNTFRMDSLLEEMREIEMNAPIQGPGVAALATANPYMLQEQDSIWAEQYLGSGKQFDQEFHDGDQTWTSNVQHQPNEVFEFGFGPNWAQEYLQSSEHTVDAADMWTDAAQKIETNHEKAELQETANQLLESTMDDPKFTYSKFMKFMGMIGDGAVSIEKGNVVENEWAQEFESLNQEPKVASRWVKQFLPEPEEAYETNREVTSSANDSSQKEMLSMLEKQWKLASENTEQNWMSDFLDQYEAFKTYPFAEDNPMKSSSDPLAEGKRKLEAGDLPSAVLCFEVAAQQNPESIESWLLLGTTQAENEQDPSAIPALKKCLSLDPSNLTAMMALAVSYTNESYQNQACQLLKDWLRHNPKYSDLVANTPDDEHMMNMASMGIASSMLSPASYQEVKDLFIKAARLNPQNNIDADVQCGLGVLFNLSSEFDKAVDCFKAALQVKSQDSRMWNRLGATLANGNRSEEAVDAYHNALQLAPGFIRARYNLGITCVNLKAHREAAEHLLTALNQQAAGRGIEGQASWSTMSDSIWSTLRLVTSLLDRHDLFPYIEARDLKKLNGEFGIE